MSKIAKHIQNAKHILWVCFFCFALSPCLVKEALFGVATLEYAKPLNKSRTTTHTNTCQYAQFSNQISVIKQSQINKPTKSFNFFGYPNALTRSEKKASNYSKTFSGNSPPKYILYKRLKLAIV